MIKALIINRYDDTFSNYEKYIPHKGNEISYICLEKKDKFINKDKAKQIEIVKSLEKEIVLEKARKIFKISKFEYVIAFSEHDLDVAAEIRTELNINGHKIKENMLCRNKIEMKKNLGETKIKYPKYKKISSKKEVLDFLKETKDKIVIKPETGDASKGVYIIEKETDIPEQIDLSNYEAEEFIEGEIYHIDAITTCGELPYFKLSKYINNCLEFTKGKALGSVTVKDYQLEKQAIELTKKICKSLRLNNQAIHLELIRKKNEFFFLEIGGRVGGGEIPFVTLFNEGVDLYELWAQAIFNKNIDKKNTKLTGFIMMPNPFKGGYKFKEEKKIESDLINYIKIKKSGKKEPFSYENIPARIHFCGNNQVELESEIKKTMHILENDLIELKE